jgi:hypothetical protein
MSWSQLRGVKRPKHSVKFSDFTVWRHTWRKNWVNCAVLKGNSAGLRTVLSSRLSHRVLRSSLRDPTVFSVYLPTPRWHYLNVLNRTDTRNWQTWWENCAVPENIQFSFSCSFLYSSTAQFNVECMGPVLSLMLNTISQCRYLKADSHIPCRSHAVSLPFPCHVTNMPFWKRPLKAMAGSWQGRGRVTAWDQHGNGMVCVN